MEQKTQEKADSNVVYVGKKSNMAYVMAAMTQFNSGHIEIHVKARGNSISKCVDVAEILKNKFLPDVKVKDIRIATEQMKVEGGSTVGVSTMEIILAK
ncbi:MAG: DNA-binding protein Alba [Candidatus Aenigmarchaeota archaeon]|nr:DNA-binding protein Alba [Candidatus Aenigmarchaeota archaeon]